MCEISLNKKKIIVTVTYRRHHKGDANQLNSFITSFKDMRNNINDTKPHLVTHLGDFNGHNTHWWLGDKNRYSG